MGAETMSTSVTSAETTTAATTRIPVGVLVPAREAAIAGDYRMGPLLDFAREAEDAGFDSLWIGDSLMARRRLDAFVALAQIATVTNRITLGTACLIPGLRNPVIGANLVASVHHAIGDRLELALGCGFPIPPVEHEYGAAGVPFNQRVGRLDETVRLWRQAWRSREPGAPTGFPGRYWQVEDLDRLPPPATATGPRIWYAGQDTPRVVERVARLYDGWLPFLPSSAAYARAWQRIGELAAEAGRPAGAIFPGMYATICIDDNRERAREQLEEYVQAYYGYPLEITSTVQAFCYGTAEECATFLAEYVAAGARHLVIRIGSLRRTQPLAEILAAVRTAV